MGAPYIYDISRLRVKDLHSATYIYVVRRLRVNSDMYEHKLHLFVDLKASSNAVVRAMTNVQNNLNAVLT